MPIIFEKSISTTKKLAVWQITETSEQLFHTLQEFPVQSSNKRQLEYACSALLINYLTGTNTHSKLSKNVNGKPIIIDSNTEVSFSHSKDFVACLIDLEGNPVGVDIERIRDKIKAIEHKFVSKFDSTSEPDIIHQHLIWGAKEVLFKLYSLKNVNFIEDLKVNFINHKGIGTVNKTNYLREFDLEFMVLERDFMLVYNV